MAKLSLFYPLTPYRINQGWGVNGEYYRANGINILGHNGIDLGVYHGQPVYASHDGTAFYEQDDSQGQGVVIISDKAYDYKGGQSFFKTIYWHLCDPLKEPQHASPIYKFSQGANNGKGMQVKAGDLIGFADNTGFSSGDHTHFGLKPIRSGQAPTSGDAPDIGIGAWINVEANNGYSGAIDPTPFWNGHVATDAAKVLANLTLQVSLLQQVINLLLKFKK